MNLRGQGLVPNQRYLRPESVQREGGGWESCCKEQIHTGGQLQGK